MSAALTLRVGILGVGSIGQTIAKAIDGRQIDAELVAISDQDGYKAESFGASLESHPKVVSATDLIQRADLVVEAASQSALMDFVPRVLSAGRDVLVMSVGGLLGHDEWFRHAQEKGCRIYVPSGAIAGLDGIKSASIGKVQSVMLTSRKPLAALRGTKFVVERGLNLDELREETVIFEGTAEDAAQAFPTTSNVAASVRLAVDHDVPVCVRIVAVPEGDKTIHEIRAYGEFGRLSVDVENVLSKANPRTSQLAAFSALATLKNLTRAIRVGT